MVLDAKGEVNKRVQYTFLPLFLYSLFDGTSLRLVEVETVCAANGFDIRSKNKKIFVIWSLSGKSVRQTHFFVVPLPFDEGGFWMDPGGCNSPGSRGVITSYCTM